MANKTFIKGETVTAKEGKHTGETGIVEHSDKSITTVRFGSEVDPVWTKSLERAI